MKSGIDQTGVDPDVRPQDDLFAHVNGRWLATTQIPEDRGRYGTFDVLRETAEEHVRAIIEEVAAGAPEAGTVAAKVGDLYASFMDEAAVEALGVAPARRRPRAGRGGRGRRRRRRAERRPRARRACSACVIAFVNTDDRDPGRYVVYLEQAGLGLPDESYYREDAARRQPHGLRRARRADARPSPAGPTPRAPPAGSWPSRPGWPRGHWDKVTNRDAGQDLQPRRPRRPGRAGPRLRLGRYLDGLGAAPRRVRRGRRPPADHVRSLATALARGAGRGLARLAAWHVVHAARALPVGSRSSRPTSTSTAAPCPARRELRERWKRGVALVEEAARRGRRPAVRRAALPAARQGSGWTSWSATCSRPSGAAFAALDWMSDDTRREALDKLGAVPPKIGYPDAWRDYSGLEIAPDDLLGNVRRARGVRARPPARQARRAGRPRRVAHDAADGQRLLQPGH